MISLCPFDKQLKKKCQPHSNQGFDSSMTGPADQKGGNLLWAEWPDTTYTPAHCAF